VSENEKLLDVRLAPQQCHLCFCDDSINACNVIYHNDTLSADLLSLQCNKEGHIVCDYQKTQRLTPFSDSAVIEVDLHRLITLV